MSRGKRVVAVLTRLAAWWARNRIVTARLPIVKVNLGSGLSVAEGWINVDASLNALASAWPRPVLRYLYRFTDVSQWFARDEYVKILKSNTFVHHWVEYGVPFRSEAIDYLYCSHMLEHLFLEEATRLLSEMYRTLRPGGRLRIAVPDLAYAVDLYRTGQKERALSYFFTPRRSERFEQHHYMYDFELLERLLAGAKFREIERCAYQVGKVPDIEKLDNRPEETLFVEATR